METKLDKWQGHMVLFAKGHYKNNEASQLEGLRRIWALRCGLLYEHVERGQSDEYIADELFRIIQITMPKRAERMWEILHKELARPSYQYEGLNAIEMTIMIYRSQLLGLQVREKVGNKWVWIVELPKPKKRVFNRILRGNEKYRDYDLIKA
ncbi:MAG: hypothetical protein OQK82_08375 [Candidatus Pacearchaeota archaeon]|nr:hypothetical protein [Candidatus Pacearchaeota archaeon]